MAGTRESDAGVALAQFDAVEPLTRPRICVSTASPEELVAAAVEAKVAS